MFDRCKQWRGRLSLYADRALPDAQILPLKKHLTHCKHCRRAAEADEVLHDILGMHLGLPSDRDAQRFNERVLARLRNALPTTSRLLKTSNEALNEFLHQVISGVVVAGSITFMCLFARLNVTPTHRAQGTNAPVQDMNFRNDPPVPLSALLQNPSPRAAMLWSAPGSRPQRRPLPLERRSALPRLKPTPPRSSDPSRLSS